jgi:hypothetical protein
VARGFRNVYAPPLPEINEKDPYVSEYFKDLLSLQKNLVTQTPDKPEGLEGINEAEGRKMREKMNDDFYQDTNPTYRPQSRWEVSSCFM